MAELGKRKQKQKKPREDLNAQLPDAQLERKNISTALMSLAQRALTVTPRDIDVYVPRELDLKIAEAMLAGAITFKAIGEVLDLDPQAIGKYLRDPLVCAWISRTVHGHVHERLGMVDAAMLNAALSGKVAAAKLLYERYGEMVQRSLNVHVNGSKGLDFRKFEDADLDALIRDANKNAGIIDIERAEDPPAPSDRGEEAP